MQYRMGKWYQYILFSSDPLTSGVIPHTRVYNAENLLDFLKLYETVYIKHDRGGQGKGIYKVYKEENGRYCLNGFTPKGEELKISIATIEDFKPETYPYMGFGGLLDRTYIVQEGINSSTLHGMPLAVRVHVQLLNGEWGVSGMYGKVASARTYENGIVNANQGSQVMTISELLSIHLGLDNEDTSRLIESIEEIALTAAKLVSKEFPRLEYGIDFGIDANANPVLFEVNTYPGIGNFAKIENKRILNKIRAIRKLQQEEKNNPK
ncbi:YheC/YheD family protein [Sporosarcina koreensis]|uniref:YheC/YheD family protein n=1 Tax=Sporosarcina koreensis TaxID=334735 RepID=A0ABW0TTM0_9BACL